jgi:hypothetical protein
LGFLSALRSLVMAETHDVAVLLFEFEEVLVVAAAFMILLVYFFYYKYPYNKEFEKNQR